MNTDTLRRSNEIANSLPQYDPTLPDTETTAEAETFEINSDAAANWLLRRLANLEAEKARVTAQATAIVKQLESDAERLRFLFGSQLESYCRGKMEQGRGKTVRFLQGSCFFRTVPAGVRIADTGAALQFAQETLLGAVKSVRTLDTTVYRELAEKHLQETGEVLPGVETTLARESFSVKFGKAEA